MKKLYSYFFSDLSNGKQSPTENSYRSEKENSCNFLQFSISNEAEAKQDLKGRVYMVNLPPENGGKEEPGPVEKSRDQNDDQRVQANNNEGEPSVEVPAVNLGDQVDDQSVQRRSNNEPPAKAPGGETGRKRADKEENLPQDRSRDGSPQDRGIERRASFPPDLPQKDVHPQMNRSFSVFNQLQHAGRQRKLQLGNGQFCCHVYFKGTLSTIFLYDKNIKKICVYRKLKCLCTPCQIVLF